jgi:hypothetical protein
LCISRSQYRTSAHLKIRLEKSQFPESLAAAREVIVGFYNRDAAENGANSAIEIADSDDEFEVAVEKQQPVDRDEKTGKPTLSTPLCKEGIL